MRGYAVEPDRFDNLPADIAFATDIAKDRWCPKEARDRLVAYIEKAQTVLNEGPCPTSAKP